LVLSSLPAVSSKSTPSVEAAGVFGGTTTVNFWEEPASMSLRRAISLGAFLSSLQAALAVQRTQDSGPTHLQDPNLFLGPSKEPGALLVLPKGLTQITPNMQTEGGSEYSDRKGSSFLNPSNYRRNLTLSEFKPLYLSSEKDRRAGLPGGTHDGA
jgi:hypothetical protein